MTMNDAAIATCSRSSCPVSDEQPASAPSAATCAGKRGQGARFVAPITTPFANESARGKSAPAPVDLHQHGFKSIRVVFREDGSAVLEYSQLPPDEPLDEELAAALIPTASPPIPVVPVAGAVQFAAPDLTTGRLLESPPPRVQWFAPIAGLGSIPAFAVGALVATLVLVCGHLVYRSLASSAEARSDVEHRAAATFEPPANDRVVPRIQAEPAPTPQQPKLRHKRAGETATQSIGTARLETASMMPVALSRTRVATGQSMDDEISPAVAASPRRVPVPGAAAPLVQPIEPAAPLRTRLEMARAAVQAWAAAWSHRDVDAYVAAYVPDYAGRVPGMSRAAWIEQRRAQIVRHKHIEITLSSLRITPSGDAVVAEFDQTRRADRIKVRSRKTLELVPVSGRWLIRREVNEF